MAERLRVYKVAEIPRENRLHEGRMTRYSIRTKNAQIVFADITPQPMGKQGNHRPPHDHPTRCSSSSSRARCGWRSKARSTTSAPAS